MTIVYPFLSTDALNLSLDTIDVIDLSLNTSTLTPNKKTEVNQHLVSSSSSASGRDNNALVEPPYTKVIKPGKILNETSTSHPPVKMRHPPQNEMSDTVRYVRGNGFVGGTLDLLHETQTIYLIHS